MKIAVFLISLIALFGTSFASTKGVLELDAMTFNKIVDGSRPTLVAFTEYAWKDPKDYNKVAEEFKDTNVLITKIDGKNNEDIKDKYGVTDYPTLFFFPQGEQSNPVKYSGAENSADIVDFVKSQVNPLLKQLKTLAKDFIANPSRRTAILEEAQKVVAELPESEQEIGNIYVASMKRIQEKGDDYVKTERERLNSLIDSKSTVEKKKAEFSRKLNVLNAFSADIVA